MLAVSVISRDRRRVWSLTFLAFLINHCLTESNCARISEDSKNLIFGPPSFFGLRVIILNGITPKKTSKKPKATNAALTKHRTNSENSEMVLKPAVHQRAQFHRILKLGVGA